MQSYAILKPRPALIGAEVEVGNFDSGANFSGEVGADGGELGERNGGNGQSEWCGVESFEMAKAMRTTIAIAAVRTAWRRVLICPVCPLLWDSPPGRELRCFDLPTQCMDYVSCFPSMLFSQLLFFHMSCA